MQMDSLQKQYNLSREAASRLLLVSVRTLDRYIRSKKLSTQVVDGRIWLSKQDIDLYKLVKKTGAEVDNSGMSISKESIDGSPDKVDDFEVLGQSFVDTASTKKEKGKSHVDEFKVLFLDLKEEIKEKQERLEVANYRVGQLEAQLRNSIPMLEYRQEKYELDKAKDELKNQLNESNGVIKRLSLGIKYEKFNKRLFLIILLIILALQPLWVLINWPSSR